MSDQNQPVSKPEEDIRLEKLASLRQKEINPYPAKNARTHTIHEVLTNFVELEKKQQEITIVGRIVSLRRHGGSTFAHIQDGSEKIQTYFKKDEVGSTAYETLDHLIDVADFIQVSGSPFTTHKGEHSLLVNNYQLLTKSLLPLPEKHHGLSDTETRYRQRYLDLLANEEVKASFKKRAAIVDALREFMSKHDFLEVETPILQPIYGGALAEPFTTYHNALESTFYLRIAPELYLKRLIVGGYERVYELARCFRNEGISREHNPEFTMMEFYMAYADYNDLMKLTEEMLEYVVTTVFGGPAINFEGKKIDFTPPYPRKPYRELLMEHIEFDIENYPDTKNLAEEAGSRGVKVEQGWGRGKIIDELYKDLVRPHLTGPLFLIDHPIELSPLAKQKKDNPQYVERMQLIITGREVVNAYSELNDPIDQLKRFQEGEKMKKAGDEEAHQVDDDYITALKHGMPPTAGWGMGIDRLTAILTNASNLKEIILFPTLKPKIKNQDKSDLLQFETKNQENIEKAEHSACNPSGEYQPFPRDKALQLLHEHVKSDSLRKHMYAAEAIMRALAKKFGENEDAWGLAGLLHDIDWEETENNMSEHTVKSKGYLTEAGLDPQIIHAIYVHNDTHNIPLETSLEKTLFSAEELTGLITACAHVRPDKKLENVKVSSVKKKFKQKAFAAGVRRDIINRCEELIGITLDELIEIELDAMKEIAEELGL